MNLDELRAELRRAIELIADLKSQLVVKEQLVAQKSKLEILGELGLGFSHEIKNPLAAVMTYIELLENSAKEESQRSLIKKLKYSALEIDTITNNMLLYSKDLKPNVVNIQFQSLIEQSLQVIEVAAIRKQVKFDVCGDAAFIKGDFDLLKRCVVNLVANAVDACDLGGDVMIKLGVLEHHMYIAVEDSGHGVQNPDNLFKPFSTTKTKGMGLGLALVKKIIEAHKGQILYKPPLKLSGARFELLVPK